MKQSPIIIGLSAAIFCISAPLLTGCSLLEKITGPDNKTTIVANESNKTVQKTSEKSIAQKEEKTVVQANKQVEKSKSQTPSKDKAKDKTKPSKRTQNENSSAKITIESLNGEWLITALGSTTIPASDEMPYIIFDTEGKFYSSNGCNILNGAYSLEKGNVLKFSSVLSTMKYCPEATYDTKINSILNDEKGVSVNIKRIGQESYLNFLNSAGSIIMTARRHNMEFLNGQWQIVAINGNEIDNEEVNIFFDIPQLKVHGNTGCNYFNGQIYINPSKSNAIDISNMAVTRMACPNQEVEDAMLLALEQVSTAIKNNDNHVILLDAGGKEQLVLKKINIEK